MPLTCKGKLQILNTSKTCRKSCTINSWLTGRSSEVQGKPQSRLIRLHFCYSWNRCQNHKRMTSAKSRPPSLKLMHSGRDWEKELVRSMQEVFDVEGKGIWSKPCIDHQCQFLLITFIESHHHLWLLDLISLCFVCKIALYDLFSHKQKI